RANRPFEAYNAASRPQPQRSRGLLEKIYATCGEVGERDSICPLPNRDGGIHETPERTSSNAVCPLPMDPCRDPRGSSTGRVYQELRTERDPEFRIARPGERRDRHRRIRDDLRIIISLGPRRLGIL